VAGKKARELYDEMRVKVETIADQEQRKHLTPSEAAAARSEVRAEARGAILSSIDLRAARATVEQAARALDFDNLMTEARHLPRMGSGADSQSHDLRVIAEEVERARYARRLAKLDANGLVAEAQRVGRSAGAAAEANSSLAEFAALAEAVDALPSTALGRAGASSALLAARKDIESTWETRRDCVAQLAEAAEALDSIMSWAEESGRVASKPSPHADYLRWREKQAAAA
jgi:hypothetical protein